MAKSETKKINLALQGGGSHGAFTWGVLDRLLDDERLAVDGISATSAGAMNGAAFTYGYAMGGRRGAQHALAEIWERVSAIATPQWQAQGLQKEIIKFWKDYMKAFQPLLSNFSRMSYLMSPYEFNPLNINPLRQVVEQTIDFEILRNPKCPVRLYLSATNVRTGKIKVFEQNEISVDSILASACLPMVFQAVEINGEHYWDGGFMGNPALFPLIYNCEARDIVIVHINPLERPEVPQSAFEILNRVNEISFNSSLMREMRAIGFVTKLIDDGIITDGTVKRIYVHAISADEVTTKLGIVSTMNTDWEFLTGLRNAGRRYAEAWIESVFEKLGRESTVDIQKTYM